MQGILWNSIGFREEPENPEIRKIRKSGNPIWGAALRAALGEENSLARNFLLGEQGGPVVFSFAAAELEPNWPRTPREPPA